MLLATGLWARPILRMVDLGACSQMDIETFARAEVAAHGSRVVFHDGIWWKRGRPFYSWPLNFLKAFPRGKARPPFLSRVIGYWHVVPTEAEANAKLHSMFLIRDISLYDLGRLSSKKRNQIRRGLERVEIRKMDNVRDLLEQGVEINRSALLRQGWADPSSTRWFVDEKLWRQEIERTHEFGARESWGAYCSGRLVAWMQAFEVEGIVKITNAMSHSAYLSYYPNDALFYTFLMDCRARPGVTSVFFGKPVDPPTLSEYKKKLGFEPVQLPVYRWLSPGVRSVLNLRTRYRPSPYLKDLRENQ